MPNTKEITPEKVVGRYTAAELQELILLAIARLEQLEEAHRHPQAKPAPKQPAPYKARKHGWTPDDDEQLHRRYPTTKVKHLTKVFGRSEEAITAHARRLGIRKHTKDPPAGTKAEAAEASRPNSLEEHTGRHRQAQAALQKAKQHEAGRRTRPLRVDARTTVLVPIATNDAKYIKEYRRRREM